MADRKTRTRRATRPEALIRTQRIELVAPDGQLMAVLGRIPGANVNEPSTGLLIHDARGERRILLTCDSTGPSIHLMAAGTVVLSLGITDLTPDDPSSTLFVTARTAAGDQVLNVELTTPATR